MGVRYTYLLCITPLFFHYLQFVEGDEKLGLCCICHGCTPPLRFNEFVDANGKTCAELALEMADPTLTKQGSTKCKNNQQLHYSRCCDSKYVPLPIKQNPTAAPGPICSRYPRGTNPTCNLCHDGNFPGRPYTVTAVMGIPGNPTCQDLYCMGLQGTITDQYCKPMQYYMDGPCGFGYRVPFAVPTLPPAPKPVPVRPAPSPAHSKPITIKPTITASPTYYCRNSQKVVWLENPYNNPNHTAVYYNCFTLTVAMCMWPLHQQSGRQAWQLCMETCSRRFSRWHPFVDTSHVRLPCIPPPLTLGGGQD